ncbi:hypothetical protein GCM10027168_70990 [Streptomyces capparidis]
MDPTLTNHPRQGTLSADGRTLTFTDIDLRIPTEGSHTCMWVCVTATDDAPWAPPPCPSASATR